MSRAARSVVLGLLVACFGSAGVASGHGRSLSYSSFRLTRDGALVQVRIPRLELARVGVDPVLDPAAQPIASRMLADGVRLTSHGRPCPPVVDPMPLPAAEGLLLYEWVVRCEAPGEPAIESSLLLDAAPSHLHFARVELPDGSVREAVLTEAEPRWSAGPLEGSGSAARAGSSIGDYVALGIEHIATGYDHVAFVLALLLLAASLGEVAGLVTAFTLAHSLTLAIATLGWLRPEGAAVEALIGFSIALVAAENGWLLGGRPRAVPLLVVTALLGLAAAAAAGYGSVSAIILLGLALFSACHFALLDRVARPARLRAAVAFAFGLVHGFGFAGVLAELDLPRERLAAALFGFNVGVELGQLAIVAGVWPLLWALTRTRGGRWHERVAELGSAAICGLGVFWFVARAFG